MYINIGQATVIKQEEIIGIFDIDNTTVSKKTRDYLNKAEKKKETYTVSFELPKSFIVCSNKNKKQKVYLSQLSVQTLQKRKDFLY